MANTLLTPTKIVRKALAVLHNNLVFSKNVNRQYDSEFAKTGAKIGSNLTIRLPVLVPLRTTAAMDVSDVTEKSIVLTVAKRLGFDLNFTSEELTMTIDDFSERYLAPNIAKLASQLDYEGLTLYNDVANQVGTAGTDPATALVALQAGAKLSDNAAPDDRERRIMLNPAANATMVDGLKGLFQSGSKIGEQYEKGMMGNGVLGFDWYATQNINRHTTGAFAGTVLVNDTVADGDSVISMDAFTDAAPTLKKGDVFTIANVLGVNPETKKSTGVVQQFVVTADKTGTGNAAADIAVSPSFITTGPYQTINALPADNAAVTFAGSASTAYAINMAYHKNAFTLVTADLEMPQGVHFAARENYEGISMRIVRNFDIVNDRFPCRVDVLYGWKTLRPELACRIIGK